MEGFVTAKPGCFIIENRHKLVATITFRARSKHYSSWGREKFIEIIICSVYTCHKSIQDTVELNRDCVTLRLHKKLIDHEIVKKIANKFWPMRTQSIVVLLRKN